MAVLNAKALDQPIAGNPQANMIVHGPLIAIDLADPQIAASANQAPVITLAAPIPTR